MVDEVLGKCMGIGVRSFSGNKLKSMLCNRPERAKEKERERETPDVGKVSAQGEGARTGMSRAIQVAKCRETLGEAVEKLKGNFWAASSKAARDVKRTEVLRLAKLVNGSELYLFPLKQRVVEGVAACLKSAGMKSGDQYLNELKLMHIEDGFNIPPWLTRVMGLCKKAMTRNKGPTKKAVEFKVEDIKEDTWQRGGINPPLSYTCGPAYGCSERLRQMHAGGSTFKQRRKAEGCLYTSPSQRWIRERVESRELYSAAVKTHV